MYHYRPKRKIYKSFPKPKTCPFCNEAEYKENLLGETAHSHIIRNRVPYDVWELRDVTDHLMVIPKKHTGSLLELSDAERLDIMKTIAQYEAKGYNVYARGQDSSTRSVAHQHTHLLKTTQKLARGSLLMMKPYILIKF